MDDLSSELSAGAARHRGGSLPRCLVLDAMGVLFAAADDVAELLIPFVLAAGGERDTRAIESAYLDASLGTIGADDFWVRVGLAPDVERAYLSRHRLAAGALELLTNARSTGLPVWCLSNDVARWSKHLRASLGIEPLLAGAVISSDVGVRKPDRGIYERLLAGTGCLPGELKFVDDRPKNVAAAAALGIPATLFTGPQDYARLSAELFAAERKFDYERRRRHRAGMSRLKLTVLSLRYSSWSMRPWLVLYHTGAPFETETVALPHMSRQSEHTSLEQRRAMGSVRGLFPVLRVDGTPIHESLAICEYVADAFPDAQLWPAEPLQRAAARAICSEMVSGFSAMRTELSCHLFGRVPSFKPSDAARTDIDRVFELWGEKLATSGGPFLFGRFTIADAMYYPVLTRFRTYGIQVPSSLAGYADALEAHPAVRALIAVASTAPRIPVYDDYLKRFGGDPDAGLHAKN